MHRSFSLAVVPFALALTACVPDPIEWRETTSASFGDATVVLDSSGALAIEPAPTVAGVPETLSYPAMCKASFRTAQGQDRMHAVWWSVRPDSSARLYYASSMDGGRTWSGSTAVDTLDRSDRGCDRPAPALTVMRPSLPGGSESVYTAYSMKAPEGFGVFFSHEMGGFLGFHAPVQVIYGDRLVEVSIAADGQHVAVAYVDPSARTARVDVAVSRSQGHFFEDHARASTGSAGVSGPSVAISGDLIAVGWRADSSYIARVGRLTFPTR